MSYDRANDALLRDARRRYDVEDAASWAAEAMFLTDYPLAEQLAVVRNYAAAAMTVRDWRWVADAIAHLDRVAAALDPPTIGDPPEGALL